MKISILSTLTAGIILVSQAYASDITNKELVATCSKKTVVFGRDEKKNLVKAGEKLDGFCTGYLQATFSSLTNSFSCKTKESDPAYLLSVYQQYINDTKVAESTSASATLMQAFRRVAECK